MNATKVLIDWSKYTLEERRVLILNLIRSVPWKLPVRKPKEQIKGS